LHHILAAHGHFALRAKHLIVFHLAIDFGEEVLPGHIEMATGMRVSYFIT
jgi:hypothetical protein